MTDDAALSSLEIISIGVTIVLGILLALLAWASVHNGWLLWLAASVGALGGLVHEIAQSGGKILFFQRHQDGIYLGSLAGMILGAVAGLLVVRGQLGANATTQSTTMTQLSYEIFMAGLALKGVTEAAAGRPVQ